MLPLAAGVSLNRILGSAFFLPYRETAPLLTVGWTLNYEMFFYAIFGLFLWLPRTAALLATGLTLVTIVMLGAAYPGSLTIDYYSNPIVIEFVAGMAIGFALPAIQRIPFRIAAMLAAGSAILFAGAAFTGDMTFSNWRFLIWGIPSALLVFSAIAAESTARD